MCFLIWREEVIAGLVRERSLEDSYRAVLQVSTSLFFFLEKPATPVSSAYFVPKLTQYIQTKGNSDSRNVKHRIIESKPQD